MADTLLFVDDWTGTNGDPWNTSKWGANAQSGSGISIQNNKGSITLPSTTNQRSWAWAYSQNSLYGEVLVTINKGTASRNAFLYVSPASDFPVNATSANSVAPPATNGVMLYTPLNSTASGSTTLVAFKDGVMTTGPSVPVALALNTDYKVRIRRAADYLKVKIWAASTTEPTAWSQTWTPAAGVFPTNPTDQRAGLGAKTTSGTTNGTSTVTFDDFSSSVADDTVGVPGGYVAQPLNASALTPDAVAKGNMIPVSGTVLVTEDAYTDDTATNYGTRDTLIVSKASSGTGATRTFIKPPAVPSTVAVVRSANLLLVHTGTQSVGTRNINLYRVNADWSESTIRRDNEPSTTFLKTYADTTFNDATVVTVDVKEIYEAANFGIMLEIVESGATKTYASSEYANPDYRPKVEYQGFRMPEKPVTVTAESMSAFVFMPDAVVTTARAFTHAAEPMTAVAVFPQPVVSIAAKVTTDAMSATALLGQAEASAGTTATATAFEATGALVDAAVSAGIDIAAEPLEAAAELQTGPGFSKAVNVETQATEALAEILEPSVATARSATVTGGPMAAVAAWIGPEAVNGEAIVVSDADDKYFQRVWADMPNVWFRLNDRGSQAVNRMGGLGGTYVGVQVNRKNGPDGRHSVFFDGSAYIQQTEKASPGESLFYGGTPRSSLEFSFRTTKANQFLMVSRDATDTNTATTTTPAREVYLRDGKISYRTHYFQNAGTQRAPYEFTGFKNLADGKWHSVVIKGLTDSFGEKGVEIWVDGKFEVRRTQSSGAGELHGFPDYIGSRPSAIDGVEIGALPSSQNFVGEMSEVVFYPTLLSEDSIARHFYAFMGYAPIEAQPMEAFGFMTAGNTGRGSQKRALALFFTEGNDQYQVAGDRGNNKMNFNPFVGFPVELGGYKMFYKSVDDINGSSYRDPVTDAQTLLSLKRDVDITDYDVIMFKEWPDEGEEIDQLNRDFPGALERLTEELRWANDQGVGLFITHPRLAVDLGIMNRVEFIETLKERQFNSRQGNAFGNYDYGSAIKFPWNIVATSGLESSNTIGSIFNGVTQDFNPVVLDNKAYFYEDMNFNNKFRVRALVDGLTDIPSYMISDAVYHVDYDDFGWQSTAFKYLHRYEGLRIGDEYLFAGTNPGSTEYVSGDLDNYRVGRPLGYYATPVANVKAGTIVTTFGATEWRGKSLVDNPYKDYATTVVLNPGDRLKGRPVGGKIYVNFTEQPSRQPESVALQVVPDNAALLPRNYNKETAAQREWEYSDTRKSLRTTTGNSTVGAVAITLPNGQAATIQSSGGGNKLTAGRSNNLFPIEYKISWQMNRRGLYWLGEVEEVEPGAVVIKAEPMAASADVVEPKVVAQKAVSLNAAPMVALAQMPRVKEDKYGDVEIRTLPMTATAEFTAFSKVISAEPMTATAELVENFNMIHAGGEQVVLYWHNIESTVLYFKEDA